MSKRMGRNGRRGARRVASAVDAIRARAPRSPAAKSGTGGEAGGRRDDVPRREFIKRVGVAAAVIGMPGLPLGALAAAQGGQGQGRPAKPSKTKVTLFFNLSHLSGFDTTHYLNIGGRKYALTAVADKPQVLGQARRTNAFLAAIDDRYITHHAKNVDTSGDAVTLAYLTCNENAASGTWEMTSLYFNIPVSAAAYAYARAREATPAGPLPLSGKRRTYGLRAAVSQSDLEDEFPLVDFNSHAEALVGLHPDLLSIDPDSSAHIQLNYVSQDSFTQFLAGTLQTMGPAVPQGTTSLSGLQPWATLLPLVDVATGQPYKKSDGALNQYYPDWNAEVEQQAARAMTSVHPVVRNDPTLGLDVSDLNLNDPGQSIPSDALRGKKWFVRDGIATVLRPSGPVVLEPPKVAFRNQGPETGLYVSEPTIATLADGRVQVQVDNISNWFLRYLGMWVQFVDPAGNVLPASSLPSDTLADPFDLPGPYPRSGWLDKDDALFVGILSPALAVAGIPVYPGQFSPTINIPKAAQTMRILYAGLGETGSIPADPAKIIAPGIGMTASFNYGVVGLFMAAGVSTFSDVFKQIVAVGGGAVAAAVTTLIGPIFDGSNPGDQLLTFAMNFLKVLFQRGVTLILADILEVIAAKIAAAQIIDSIPVAGQCARAAAAIVGGVQLLETSIEVALSPAVYTFEVVQTHDLAITILPDPKSKSFPDVEGRSLYYRVSYLFDNGTAHTLDAVDVPDRTVASIPIAFTGIPRGGKVNISIGFYARASTTPPGQNDWCAGYATTGLIDNTIDTAPPLAITETKIPIQPSTQYVHTRKTALDPVGNHVWTPTATPPPYLPPPNGQTPSLGALNAITVRQGTSNPPQQGYVGYAWRAFSTGVDGCGGPAPGQFDQMANLNTDDGSGGANAQNGYVNSAGLCGFPNGVRIGYNLLTHEALNLYLDTDALMIRQVNLDPPGFAGPGSNRSFGMLNMESTRCLLHPAGHVVSVSMAFHKLEVLQIPAGPVSDADARQFFLARTLSGPGTLAGLMMSPTAMAIAPDGAILVLEQGNNRIQAFDLGGNPVEFFRQQPDPHFFELDATQGVTYLDVAVEFTGYLYVLSTDASNAHRLDIYHPTQASTAPICTTHGVNAAKLAVDFWRSAYMLNYEVLQLPDGGGIPPFTEPSVSLWLPTPPT